MTKRCSSAAAVRVVSSGLVVALVASSLSFARNAGAIEKAACVAAYEQTQTLRKDEKLVEARESALTCAQDGCPAVVRDECTQWAIEIEKQTPSILLVVVDAEGRDVTDVSVFIDDANIENRLDGKPISLEPGSHTVRVESKGLAPVEQEIVAREGEKNRTIKLSFAKAEGSAGAGTGDTGSTDKPEKVPGKTPLATYLLGGLGLVGLAGFVGFGLTGNSKKKSLDDSQCKPACNQSDVDAVKSKYLFADISLGVAVASFGLATLLYFTRSDEEAKPAPEPTGVSSIKFDVGPTKGGGTAVFGFAF